MDIKKLKPAPSFAALARRLGVSVQAVHQGAKRGRLGRALVTDKGQPRITSIRLAQQEWAATRRRTRPIDSAAQRAREAVQVRRELARAELAELELAERRAALVRVSHLAATWAAEVACARSRLLEIPRLWKQRCPHLSDDAVRMVADMVREAIAHIETVPVGKGS